MTKTVDVAKPEAPLSELVSLALAGTEIILTEGDQPIARLVPIVSTFKQRIAGLNRGAMVAKEDFDAPLSDVLQYPALLQG